MGIRQKRKRGRPPNPPRPPPGDLIDRARLALEEHDQLQPVVNELASKLARLAKLKVRMLKALDEAEATLARLSSTPEPPGSYLPSLRASLADLDKEANRWARSRRGGRYSKQEAMVEAVDFGTEVHGLPSRTVAELADIASMVGLIEQRPALEPAGQETPATDCRKKQEDALRKRAFMRGRRTPPPRR